MDLMKQEMKSADNGKGIGSSCNPSSGSSKQLKACNDCHTTKTPLWRGGPEGPKSLCNACGIKYNKKRREVLGLGRKEKKKMEESCSGQRVKLMALGLRRSGKLLGNLKEEEQAAILLMALSCGSVYF